MICGHVKNNITSKHQNLDGNNRHRGQTLHQEHSLQYHLTERMPANGNEAFRWFF
ncbi:hypothetical protein GJAV_G00164170 [Gymnothorax javanicus]|nr:hypothetical protein GJAV_G00164170 [Gymnothorax javanicus]